MTTDKMLAAAGYKYVADGNWGQRRYLDMGRLGGWDERAVPAEQEGGALGRDGIS